MREAHNDYLNCAFAELVRRELAGDYRPYDTRDGERFDWFASQGLVVERDGLHGSCGFCGAEGRDVRVVDTLGRVVVTYGYPGPHVCDEGGDGGYLEYRFA